MSMLRNPFTSVSNLSFLRNSSHVSKTTRDNYRPRSLSGSKNFERISPFIYDRQMMARDNRRQKQNQYLQAVGYEAYRYVSDAFDSDYNCYYSLSKHQQTSKPAQKEEKSHKIVQQSFEYFEYQPIGLKSNMKMTKDMFSSDYFTKEDDVVSNEQPLPKNGIILRKDTFGSSCPKIKKNIELNCSRLSEQPSQLVESQIGNQQSKLTSQKESDPKAFYLKTKKKVFYLYQSDMINI